MVSEARKRSAKDGRHVCNLDERHSPNPSKEMQWGWWSWYRRLWRPIEGGMTRQTRGGRQVVMRVIYGTHLKWTWYVQAKSQQMKGYYVIENVKMILKRAEIKGWREMHAEKLAWQKWCIEQRSINTVLWTPGSPIFNMIKRKEASELKQRGDARRCRRLYQPSVWCWCGGMFSMYI